jgi:putative flippase GtrA
MRRHFDWNMLRWLLVGSLTAGIDWFIFVTLYPRIGSVVLTNTISGIFAILFNYFAHRHWTFKNREHQSRTSVRYGIALFLSYLLNTILLKLFIVSGILPGTAKLMAIIFAAPVSYVLLNFLVFAKKK